MSQQPSSLPALGQPFNGGAYAGIATGKDGVPYILVKLGDKPAGDMKWDQAMAWAKTIDADLPTRVEAAMLFANVRDQLPDGWGWTNEVHEDDASYAWHCDFSDGYQSTGHKSYEGAAVAVRRFPLQSFNPFEDAAKKAAAGSAAIRAAAQALIAACDQADAAVAEVEAA